jgi:hypothetical protein
MKIFYFCDSFYLDMKTTFETSFKDIFEKKFYLIQNKLDMDFTKQACGVDIWKFKIEMILYAIEENYNEIIVISDVDILFYKPVIPIIEESMIGYEMCFQKEWPEKGINIGFISIYCNENTLDFWKTVYQEVVDSNKWDQEVVNHLLYNEGFDISWNLFPSTIWNWSQGKLDKNIALHHANCALSKHNKIEQMKYVFDFINT